jgi:CubicO group peptidase (beta-lactamase class C family)
MRNFIVLCLMATTMQVFSQEIPDSVKKKIDDVFASYNSNTPGAVVAVTRNDSVIYTKGYGQANLEYSVPIEPATVFHVASVSKQFTAYSLVLLARAGRINLDDDIRKYLTWFPDMKEKITIRNLLNHTSGIRDQWQLMAISGTRLDDVIKQDHIVKMLGQQKELNFKPGEMYIYCNSGYTMCAEIVKAVTGKTLRQFADSAIFKPLGMSNTHFHDDYQEVVKGRAYSYYRSSIIFRNSVLSYSNAGATSLFTTAPDLGKWLMNLYSPKVGDQKDIDQLVTKGKLNSGKEISYALGISVGDYKGWKNYSHSGGDAGYRTYVMSFPELRMGFVVLANIGDADPVGKTMKVVDMFLKEKPGTPVTAAKKLDSSLSILPDSAAWKKYAGNYISQEGIRVKLSMNKGMMFYTVGPTILLVKGAKDSLLDASNPSVKLFPYIKNSDTLMYVNNGSNEYLFQKYQPLIKYTDEELAGYVGTYYSDELNCNYNIVLREHQLYFTNSKYNDTKLTLLGVDDLVNDEYWWMSHVKIIRGKKGKVAAFEVNDGRIMHLKFIKR